jgi:hypothetical protein
MSEGETRTVFCQSCERAVEIPLPVSGGHPFGWYHVSVAVPAWFNARTGKPYKWVGLFCSANCLADGVPGMRAEEELMANAYERD